MLWQMPFQEVKSGTRLMYSPSRRYLGRRLYFVSYFYLFIFAFLVVGVLRPVDVFVNCALLGE